MTDKVKILICLLYYLPHRTGMQLYIERVSEELVRRGHEVTILCARHRPELAPEETINGVRIVRLWAPPIPISRGMVMPMYPFAAYRLIKQHDVVSIHTPMLHTAPANTALQRSVGCLRSIRTVSRLMVGMIERTDRRDHCNAGRGESPPTGVAARVRAQCANARRCEPRRERTT